MQMPQHHHRRVLRSSQLVELVMVSLAQIQEGLSVVQKFAIQFFNIVVKNSHETSLAIFNCLTILIFLLLLVVLFGVVFFDTAYGLRWFGIAV